MLKKQAIFWLGILVVIGLYFLYGDADNQVSDDFSHRNTSEDEMDDGPLPTQDNPVHHEDIEEQSDLELVENKESLVLTGHQTMTISGVNYKLHNNIILKNDSVLIIKDSIFSHLHNFSFQYGLLATDNSKVIVENSTIKSSLWLNWNFRNNASLEMTNVKNTGSGIWHGFNGNARGTISDVSKFNGTMSNSVKFNIDDTDETFIEIVFPSESVIDEAFPNSVGGQYSFPNQKDFGPKTELILNNIKSSRWGITYRPGSDVTIKDTDSVVITFNVSDDYKNLVAEFSGLRSGFYKNNVWDTGNSILKLINTRAEKWSPIASGNNTLIIKNSELADNAFSFGQAKIFIEDSTSVLLRANDEVRMTVTNSSVSGDVIAEDNSVIELINTSVGGQIVERDFGKVIVR